MEAADVPVGCYTEEGGWWSPFVT